MRVLLLIAVLTWSSSCYSQERSNRPYAKIGPVVAALTSAKGWTLNDDGRWISRQNRIPVGFAGSSATLIDYEKYKLGYDNFIYYQWRQILYDGDTVIALIKKYKDGYYKYEHIEEDWIDQPSLIYWTFRKESIKGITFVKDSASSLLLDVEDWNSRTYLFGENETDIIRKEYARPTGNNNSHVLRVDYILSPKKNTARFLIYSFDGDRYAPSFHGINEQQIGVIGRNMRGYDFDRCYFETDYNTFMKFFGSIK